MKRKLSLFIAVIMILSLLPAMNVFAKTVTSIPNYAGTVASDYDWSVDGTTARTAPVLDVKYDGPGTFMPGTKFMIELRNAKWSIDKLGASDLASALTGVVSSSAFTFTPMTTPPSNPMTISRSSKGLLHVMSGNRIGNIVVPTNNDSGSTSYDYYINFIGDTTAQITIGNGFSTDASRVFVPLITKLQGAGQATVEVINVDAGVTSVAPLNIANGGEGDVTVTAKDPNKDTAKNLNVGEVQITETVAGKIKFAAGKTVELTAPNGFDWAVDGGDVSVDLFGGFNSSITTVKNSTFPGTIYRKTGDNQVLVINLGSVGFAGAASKTSAGIMSLKGLVLVKNDDAVLGDINLRVAVSDAGTSTIKVGALTKRSVTLTVEDKTLPEIVSGVYSHDEMASSTQVLDFTIKETVKGAWAANADDDREMILKLNDGVKFRAVEVKKSDGFSYGVAGKKVFIDTDLTNPEQYAIETTPISGTSKNVELRLEDDKFTIANPVRSSDDLFELKLRAYVTVKPGYTGDITVSTHEDSDAFGSALSGVVGKAIDPFTVTATPNSVGIGYTGLKLSDITIKENQAGALKKQDNDTYMRAAQSVTWTTTPVKQSELQGKLRLWLSTASAGFNAESAKVEVISGDVVVDSIKTTSHKGEDADFQGDIQVAIKRASTTPSTIKISGQTLDTSRALPAGKIDLRVGGSAAANYAKSDRDFGAFDVDYFVGIKGYVDVTTAPPDQPSTYTTSIAAKVGQTTLTVGDKTITMDVAPFNQNASVMIPVRAIVEALGLASYQVNWYAPTKTVTIIDASGKTSQFRIGEKFITVGGVKVPFTGEAAVIKNGRAFLPFRALGEIVLGCPVDWDQSTQTAYFNRAVETKAPVADKM